MIVVDVETSGIDPNVCSMVSIGAIDLLKPHEQFYQECRVWEGAEIFMGDKYLKPALELNGFTEEQIRHTNPNSLEETTKAFLLWVQGREDRTLAGENVAGLDMDFLKDSAKRYGLKIADYGLGYRSIDLHSVAWYNHILLGKNPPMKNGKSSLSLDAILNYVGLQSEPNPHNALMGAKLEAEAFHRILYGKPLFDEFGMHELPEYLKLNKK